MLILIATWIAHNWWRLLIGVLAIIAIIEYHYYYKKSDKEKPDKEDPKKEKTES